MPFNWTPEHEKALLLFAIKAADLKPNSEVWEAVCQKLGGGVNANACSQKFYKLKREAETLIAGGTAPATPKSSKNGKTPASKASSGRKRKNKAAEVENDDEDDPDIDSESPSKKTKVKKETKKESVVKKEEADGDVAANVEEDNMDEEGDQD